jgi:hypothetical protein
MKRLLLALVAVLAALVGSGAVIFEGGPSPVIFPRQNIPVRFDHAYHTRKSDDERGIKGEGLSCEFCHENVSDQADAIGRDIPGHETCESCHGDWIGDQEKPAPMSECARCHSDLDPTGTSTRAQKLQIPAPNVKFAHADHVTKASLDCTECHSQVPSKTLATRDDYPTMDRCIACHQSRGVSTACKTCHVTGATGRVVTEYAAGKLMPVRYHGFAAHTGDFLRDHAEPAQRQPDFCRQCHSQDDCLQCHDGFARNVRYHAGDWIAVHGLRSRGDDYRCQSCHRLQSFCLDCHVRTGVATAAALPKDRGGEIPTARFALRVPHPRTADGWLNPASRNFHGFHAQRNIRACASCHQEQYCLTCHASGFGTGQSSIGGNPHGPNPERLRGSAARQNNARACLKCHSPYDARWR